MSSPYDIANPRLPSVRLRREAGRPVVRKRVERLRASSPAVRRYAQWFLAAGWGLEETAQLFDVSPEGLVAS